MAYSDRLYDILEAVKNLSAESDRTDADGRVLHHEGPGSVADVLSKFGTDVNAKYNLGDTLLTIALRKNYRAEVIRELLIIGADVMTRDITGRTPLHHVTIYHQISRHEPNIETVRLLLDYKADVNAKDKALRTPLHYILQHKKCKPEVVELLLKHGADVTAVDARGLTPLLLLMCNKEHDIDTETVKLLLDYKADVNATDKELQTPLHCIVQNRNYKPEVIKLLLKSGADVATKNKVKRTPIDNALSTRNIISAKIMINHALINDYGGDWMKIIKKFAYAPWCAQLLAYVNQCKSEIGEMKKHRVNDEFSLYDWYRLVNTRPKALVQTEMITENDIYNRYPVYGRTLWNVIKLCLDRADLIKQLEEL